MPTFSLLTIATALLLFIFSPYSFAKPPLTWCAYYNWAPWIYPAGEIYKGVLIEQLALFEKQHGIKTLPVIRENWKRCQVDVENGHIDMILGANKTPERSKVFRYLAQPAFINKSLMSAYALTNNQRVSKVNTLEALAQYRLATDRGNSYGNKIDEFLKNLPEKNRRASNTQEDVFRMIIANRKDYFFNQDSSLQSTLDKHSQIIPKLKKLTFKKIFTLEREVPVYMAFTKNKGVYERFNSLWIITLNQYYKEVNIHERIEFHNHNSLNYK